MNENVKNILKILEERLASITRDDLVKVLSTRSKNHHNYSLNNIITAAIQVCERHKKPFTFEVIENLWLAPFPLWNKWGYRILRGEHALNILTPINLKKIQNFESDNAGSMSNLNDITGKTRPEYKTATIFVSKPVFDISQTAKVATNKDAPHRQLNKEVSVVHFISLIQRIKDHGLSIDFIPLREGLNGYITEKRIAVNKNNSPNAQYATILHELSHYCLGHSAGVTEAEAPVAELEAEATAYVVGSYFGVDIPSEFYIAAWGGNGAAIRKSISRIDQAARKVFEILKVEKMQACQLVA
ncbi:MAG: ImmA/IrrE family metallo-endopeptidase [Candidatus Wallbacteria bacterium]